MSTPGTLETELNYFKSKRTEWLQVYRGQFAVIKGETLVGTFTTFAEAYAAGVEKVGPSGGFLVRQITEQDPSQSAPALFAGVLFACPQ